jgi:two-component system, NarL family, response regulator NreC
MTLAELTPRQLQIVELVADGRSSRDIVATLGISMKTVQTHRAAINKTLGVHRPAELVAFVHRVRAA